ncbi:MAG: hypothetical protein KDA71_19230, partial [Planctomycetales bacterium]|nr:hypothetical protein [Planctomycetales bacterium]
MAKRNDDLDLDIFGSEPDDSSSIEDSFTSPVAFRFGFVGTGQGGGRLAASFYDRGYRRVCAVNTDAADLAGLPDEICKVDLKTGGAGKDPQKGRTAVQHGREKVFNALTRSIGPQVDYLFVCAGLGGGTGSGSLQSLVQLSQQYLQENRNDPLRVGAIVSLPHPAEGVAVCRNAVLAFNDLLRLSVSPLLIVDNRRIGERIKTGVSGFYPAANEQVSKLLHLFNRLAATHNAIVTFDRADFADVLNSGICVLGASQISHFDSPADIAEAIQGQLDATVLAEVDTSTASHAACIFMGGPQVMQQTSLDVFDGGFRMLNRMLREDSVVHRGIYE